MSSSPLARESTRGLGRQLRVRIARRTARSERAKTKASKRQKSRKLPPQELQNPNKTCQATGPRTLDTVPMCIADIVSTSRGLVGAKIAGGQKRSPRQVFKSFIHHVETFVRELEGYPQWHSVIMTLHVVLNASGGSYRSCICIPQCE